MATSTSSVLQGKIKQPSSTTTNGRNYTIPGQSFTPVKSTTGSSGNTYSGGGSSGTQSSTVPLTTQVTQALAGNHQQTPLSGGSSFNPVGRGNTAPLTQNGPILTTANVADALVAMSTPRNPGPQVLPEAGMVGRGNTGPIQPDTSVAYPPGGGAYPMPGGGFGGTTQKPNGAVRLPDVMPGLPGGAPLQPDTSVAYPPGGGSYPMPGGGFTPPGTTPAGGGNFAPSSTPSSAPSSLDALAEILRNARTSGTRGYVDLLNNSAPTTFNRQAGMNAPVYDQSVPMRVAAPAAQQSRYVAPVPVATPSGSTGTPVQIAPTLYR